MLRARTSVPRDTSRMFPTVLGEGGRDNGCHVDHFGGDRYDDLTQEPLLSRCTGTAAYNSTEGNPYA